MLALAIISTVLLGILCLGIWIVGLVSDETSFKAAFIVSVPTILAIVTIWILHSNIVK